MKYKLTNKKIDYLGRTLYQIEAVKKFGNIAKGQKGGFIEKKSNLSQDGNAWVYSNAEVYGDAKVHGAAVVCDNAIVRSNSDYLIIGPIDYQSGTTTFFKTSDKDKAIKVACNGFTGDIDAFQKKVIKTHGNNNYAKEYKLAIEIAKIHILGKQK